MRVVAATVPRRPMTRETVASDTPARAATSSSVTLIPRVYGQWPAHRELRRGRPADHHGRRARNRAENRAPHAGTQSWVPGPHLGAGAFPERTPVRLIPDKAPGRVQPALRRTGGACHSAENHSTPCRISYLPPARTA
ncbi:hypothetical protein GCM10009713_22930 [Brevibacterium celere]